MVKHIVIGRTEKNAPPVCVYAGDLASEAEAAKINFPQCATFETFSQLQGVTKRNPDHNPNAPRYIQAWIEEDDAGAGAATFEAQVAAEVEKRLEKLEEELVEKLTENTALKSALGESAEAIANLTKMIEHDRQRLNDAREGIEALTKQVEEKSALLESAGAEIADLKKRLPIVEEKSEDEPAKEKTPSETPATETEAPKANAKGKK